MARATSQEFRIMCYKPLGGGKRDPNRRFQEEEKRLVYASGRGSTIELRMKRAIERCKEYMSPFGYDKYAIALTVADEQKRIDTIEREHEEKRQELLKQQEQEENGD